MTALSLLLLAATGLAACDVPPEDVQSPNESSSGEFESTSSALRAPGRTPEINYLHQTCKVTAVTPQLVGTSLTIKTLIATYTLSCQNNLSSTTTTYARTLSKNVGGYLGVTYDLTKFDFVFSPGSVHSADDLLPQLNVKYGPLAWDTAAAADASFNTLAKYDPSKVAIKQFALAPAYPLVDNGTSYSDSYPDEFPHVAARLVWTADPKYVADVYIFPSSRRASPKLPLANPLIIGDAFDPMNDRDGWKVYSKAQYKKLLSLNATDKSPRTAPAGGYDVVFVDFSQGGGDILVNSHLFAKALGWVQSRTAASTLVGGISMGGVVARLSLLYTMPENNVLGQDLGGNRVSGFVSVDAPQQGASISPRMQQIACQMAEHKWLPDSSNLNDAVNNWKQLRTPAARQMLFAQYYRKDSTDTRCGVTNTDSSVHDKFYGLLDRLGAKAYPSNKRGFRADLPQVAVAYSNFYKPNPGIDVNVQHTVGNIDPPIVDSRDFFAGGPIGNAQRQELYPGSVGFWYWSPYDRKAPKYVYPATVNGEVFKGTFIPINSALGLRPDFNVLSPSTTSESGVAAFSSFDRVYFMSATYNNYQREFKGNSTYVPNIDDKRFEHMVFDDALMSTIQRALTDLRAGVVAPLMCDGVDGGWQGCRGSGCYACDELTHSSPLYYLNHPRCLRNTTCAGEFYTCSSNCPAPTSADACNGTPGYWSGCRGNGCAVCAEKVTAYAHYFANHPACSRNDTCGGTGYAACNANCPAPTEADR